MKALITGASSGIGRDIARELERDDLTLDESVKKFEEGMALSKACKEMLDEAEKKITILIDNQEKKFETE